MAVTKNGQRAQSRTAAGAKGPSGPAAAGAKGPAAATEDRAAATEDRAAATEDRAAATEDRAAAAGAKGPAAVGEMAPEAVASKARAAQAAPRGAVVLGMHRSGTSAVAGYLARAGLFAGSEADLLPAAEDNPRGFFERQDVNGLNDQLLQSLGGAWDNPPGRRAVQAAAPAWKARADAILADLANDAKGKPLVLKDPRISLLWPAWSDALGENFALVVVDRSPVDIAESVRRRDGRPLYVALALWQLYCTELLDSLAGKRALVVHYEAFVADPDGQGPALLADLAGLLPDLGADAAQAKGFVSGEMRHHAAGAHSDREARLLTGSQLDLARWLAELPGGWVELAPPAELRLEPQEALQAVAEHYQAVGDRYGMEQAYDTERHRALHFEQATELKDRHIDNIEAALEDLRERARSQDERIAQLEPELELLRASNQKLEEELRVLREDPKAAASALISLARRSLSGHSH